MEFFESFMKFSFADSDIFRIEEDELVTSSKDVRACECVVLIRPNIALIEAKSSSPQPINKEQFSRFLEDIKEKFSDSLRLFSGIKSCEYGDAAFHRLPDELQKITVDPHNYLICLIVYGHRMEWLLGLQDAFREAMTEVIREWNIQDSNVKVFNEESALENKLIIAYIPKTSRDSVRESNGNMSQDLAKTWFESH